MNRQELTEDSLALSAVFFKSFPRLIEKCCSVPAQESGACHLMLLQTIAETRFTDTTDEGCYTAVTALISRYQKVSDE